MRAKKTEKGYVLLLVTILLALASILMLLTFSDVAYSMKAVSDERNKKFDEERLVGVVYQTYQNYVAICNSNRKTDMNYPAYFVTASSQAFNSTGDPTDYAYAAGPIVGDYLTSYSVSWATPKLVATAKLGTKTLGWSSRHAYVVLAVEVADL